jgi:hypothetical protein
VELFENRCRVEYWDERRRKEQEAEEICVMRSIVICTSCQMLMRVYVCVHVACIGDKAGVYKDLFGKLNRK